jgi:hypothetical protein
MQLAPISFKGERFHAANFRVDEKREEVDKTLTEIKARVHRESAMPSELT